MYGRSEDTHKGENGPPLKRSWRSCRPLTSTCTHAHIASSSIIQLTRMNTVRHRGMETGISESSKRVPIFSFATQGGKRVSSHFRQRNSVQAREAQIRFPAG